MGIGVGIGMGIADSDEQCFSVSLRRGLGIAELTQLLTELLRIGTIARQQRTLRKRCGERAQSVMIGRLSEAHHRAKAGGHRSVLHGRIRIELGSVGQ